MVFGERGVGLPEAVEYGGQHRGLYADSRVRHLEVQLHQAGPRSVRHGHGHGDGSAFGKLDRVAHQISEHLAQPDRISQEQTRRVAGNHKFRTDILFLQGHPVRIEGFFEHQGQFECPALQFELAGLDPGEVQHVAHDGKEQLGRILDHAQVGRNLVRVTRAPAQFGQPQNGGQGRTDLVAYVGQEGALGFACGQGFFVGQAQAFLDALALGYVLAQGLGLGGLAVSLVQHLGKPGKGHAGQNEDGHSDPCHGSGREQFIHWQQHGHADHREERGQESGEPAPR